MAVNLVSPGVNIREVDLTLGRIDATSENVGAIVGPFEKGPINEPVKITSERDLIKVFGKPKLTDDQYEYWWSASNYLSYGGSLRVIRSGDSSSATGRLYNSNIGVSDSSIELRIFNDEDYNNNQQDPVDWHYAAKTPGSWANGLNVCIIDNFADQIISGIDTSNIQVGYAVTQHVNSIAVSGTTVQNYRGYLRGLITGIGNSEFYVKIIDLYDDGEDDITGAFNPERIQIEYIKPSIGQVTPFAFNNTQGDPLYVNEITGIAITSINVSQTTNIIDWYEVQTLGLENTNIFWKSLAPKPGTSQYSAERNSKNDEIHIVIVDDIGSVTGISGNIVEKFLGLSKASDARISPSKNIYYKDILATDSEFIYAGLGHTGVPSGLNSVGVNTLAYSLASAVWGDVTQSNTFPVLGKKTYNLTGGTDYSGDSFVGGYDSPTSEIINGYQLLENPAEYTVDYLINGPSGGPSEFEAQAKANALISIATQRKDCIAVISPFKNLVVTTTNSNSQTNNIIGFFNPLTSSSYAVFDSNFKYTFDRYNNRFVYLPCNPDIAGLMARTSINNQPWFSPAGSVRGNLNNVVKLAYNPSKEQRDLLYSNRINPVIANSGAGFILFGDKTALGYPSAFDRINVRKLFLTLEKSIEQAARAQLFEFNDAITRTNFINIVEPYLRDVRAKRGITEFLIVCDESNNTPDVIDANQFKADIFVKPARSINFIGLTFVATRTGVSFSEVLGTV